MKCNIVARDANSEEVHHQTLSRFFLTTSAQESGRSTTTKDRTTLSDLCIATPLKILFDYSSTCYET